MKVYCYVRCSSEDSFETGNSVATQLKKSKVKIFIQFYLFLLFFTYSLYNIFLKNYL